MLEELNIHEFDKVYDIMQKSFPPNEIRSHQGQKVLLTKDGYKIYVVNDEKCDEIKAFIAVYKFESFVFVEHFAVNEKFRNEGLGGQMLKWLIGRSGKMICLEVEPPDSDMAGRRINFYKRNGFFMNQFPYTQPSIEEGKQPIELFIMSSSRPLTEREFEDIKSVIYKNVYSI